MLVQVDEWIYISRFKITNNAINFSIIMKCNARNFDVRDTMDCNFFVLKPRNFETAIKIFYDTLHDKFVHHCQTENFDKQKLLTI